MSDGNRNVGDTKDNISRLPDDILTRILSLLPVKTIISTSVLSKRWNPLWTTVPCLELSVSYFLPRGNDLTSQRRRKANFLAFVERFFRRNRPCYINALFLNCLDGVVPTEISSIKIKWSKVCLRDYINYPFFPGEFFRHSQSELESWTLLAERFKTQKNFISCYTNILPPRQLRPYIFNFESLVELVLTGSVVVNISKGSIFPNLRALVLDDIIIEGDFSVSNLINYCCPVLEELFVSSSRDGNDFHHLVITAISLRRLELLFSVAHGINSTLSGTRIDFSAIQYLSLQNVLIADKSDRVTGALYEANLDISTEDKYGLFWLLRMIRNVKKLTLFESTLESLESCTLPTFGYLTCLEFEELESDLGSWETLVKILENSPVLQDLRFEGLLLDTSSVFDWTKDRNIPRCLTTCLKNIEINPIQGKKKELRIIGYFLKHSQVLEKMIIVIQKNGPNPKKINTKKEILALPKGSPECEIIFE